VGEVVGDVEEGRGREGKETERYEAEEGTVASREKRCDPSAGRTSLAENGGRKREEEKGEGEMREDCVTDGGM